MADTRAAAAVLTGGASRRMGTDKATLRVEGVAMARRVADAALAAGAHPVVAVGGDVDGLAAAGLDVVPDRWPGEGPLGGLLSAAGHLAGRHLLVLACDLPMLDAATVQLVLDAPAADVALAVGDRPEPLCSRWSPNALAAADAAFAAGARSMHEALSAVVAAGGAVVEVVVDGAVLRNVNTPDDLPG
jgi:molybdopterin-guanine dinucleotide biosynthesis protein A